MKNVIPITVLFAVVSCGHPKEEKPNILFIIVDDLRPVLGCYGFPDVKSPNIDRLASEGIRFNRSYCNIPVCGASRASLFTGLRPNFPERFTNYLSRVDKDTPWANTLPEYLKNNEYITISNGKVFHEWEDSQNAWSEKPYRPEKQFVSAELIKQYHNEGHIKQFHDPASLQFTNPRTGRGPYFESSDVPDSFHIDGSMCLKAINDLERLSKTGKPFFLTVGFTKPHLPFNAPKKYFDMYSAVETANNRFLPENLPSQVRNSGEIFSYGKLEHFNTDEFHQEARIAYYACVSFIDAQVGMLIQALKEMNLDRNTIVVLIGDHGFHLGEHNFWGKHNTLLNALHTPMIIYVPGMKNRVINEIVEFIDIYPTLCELTGLELPGHLQGGSLVPLMKGKGKNWKNFLLAEWVGAKTLLTDGYSYTCWFDRSVGIGDGNKGAEMLFDHKLDPQENKNVVSEPEYHDVVDFHRSSIDSIYQNVVNLAKIQ